MAQLKIMSTRVAGNPALHFIGFLPVLVALIVVATAPHRLRAQQVDLAQEMQLFNSLPPEQQQSILQRLGGGGTLGSGLSTGGLGGLSGSSGILGGYNSSQSALLQQQMLQQQQQRRLQSQNEENESVDQFGMPTFKPGDTVLVDVALSGEQFAFGPALNPQNGAQGQGQNGGAGSAAVSGATAAQLAQLSPQQQQALRQQMGQQLSANNQRLQEQPQQPIEELQADERQHLIDLVDLIRAHNPYLLDSSGELMLPGIPAIAVAGLSEDLATRRVMAEPAFAKLQIRLMRLPLRKTGMAALKHFGYDLFDNSTFGYQPTLNHARTGRLRGRRRRCTAGAGLWR